MSNQVTLKHTDILSHLILQDHETAIKIAETPEWKDGDKEGTLHMEIKVNGVEVPTDVFRKVMEHMWDTACKEAEEKASVPEYNSRVKEGVKTLLDDKLEGVQELLNGLKDKLDYLDNEIKYPWEEK